MAYLLALPIGVDAGPRATTATAAAVGSHGGGLPPVEGVVAVGGAARLAGVPR